MLSGASDRAPLPDDLRVPLEASFPALPVGALPYDPPAYVSRARPWAPRIFTLTSLFSGAEPGIFGIASDIDFFLICRDLLFNFIVIFILVHTMGPSGLFVFCK